MQNFIKRTLWFCLLCLAFILLGCGGDGGIVNEAFNFPAQSEAPNALVTLNFNGPVVPRVLDVPANTARVHIRGLDGQGQAVTTERPPFPITENYRNPLGPVRVPTAVRVLAVDFLAGDGRMLGQGQVQVDLLPGSSMGVTVNFDDGTPQPPPTPTAPVTLNFSPIDAQYGHIDAPGNVTKIQILGLNGTELVNGANFPVNLPYNLEVGPVNLPTATNTVTVKFLTSDDRLVSVNSVPASLQADQPAQLRVPLLDHEQGQIYNNFNAGGVTAGPTAETVFFAPSAWTLRRIFNYHYGFAPPPGATLALRGADGTVYGPYPVTVGAPYWSTDDNLNVNLPAGAYAVVDSQSASWSQDAETGGRGMSWLMGSFNTPPANLNRIFVSNNGTGNKSVRVFDLEADGDRLPLRSIIGANTLLRSPRQMLVSGNELFVADGDTGRAIQVFSTSADGDVAPLRSLSGSNPGFADPDGLALIGNELVVADQSLNAIKVFDRQASGNVAPTRTIQGNNTQLFGTFMLASNGNEILVASHQNHSVLGFDVNANGNVAPTRVLSGPNTGLQRPLGLAASGNELFVASGNGNNDRISVFTLNATGDVAPLRVITGNNTGLNDCAGIAVANGEIYVSNILANTVTVYPVSGSGNIAPTRTIAGANTGLLLNNGLTIAPAP